MESSILGSIKKLLGIPDADTSFDSDISSHINGVFATLNQIGIGPVEGFALEDTASTWDQFLADDKRLNSVKTYIYLRVRLLFDPPATSYLLNAITEQIRELEWRLNVKREGESWVDPDPPTITDEEGVMT